MRTAGTSEPVPEGAMILDVTCAQGVLEKEVPVHVALSDLKGTVMYSAFINTGRTIHPKEMARLGIVPTVLQNAHDGRFVRTRLSRIAKGHALICCSMVSRKTAEGIQRMAGCQSCGVLMLDEIVHALSSETCPEGTRMSLGSLMKKLHVSRDPNMLSDGRVKEMSRVIRTARQLPQQLRLF